MENLSRRSFLKLTASAVAVASVPRVVTGALPQKSVIPPLMPEISPDTIRIMHESYDMVVETKGCTFAELYNFMKEEWRSTKLIQYPFPMQAITREYGVMDNHWKIDPATYNAIRSGSIKIDDEQHLMGLMSLGPVDDTILNRQEFFVKYGPNEALAPIGRAPINLPVLIDRNVNLSELEIVDAKSRSYGKAGDWGIADDYRHGTIRWPLFCPNDYTVVPGEDDFVHKVDAWMEYHGMTKAEAYAMTWPSKYHMPTALETWGKYTGEPIRRKL